jgi:ribosome maturation factor RimP
MKQMKGTKPFPSSFTMSQDTQIQVVEKMLEPLLVDDIFLVSVKIKPINNIKIYLDADSGLAIEKCIKINRALYRAMEEKGTYPNGDFSLEVSSPGVDEPLKLLRQFKKNTGRDVEVTMLDDSKKEGKLANVNEGAITITYTEGKGKKAETRELEIPFTNIKHTKVRVKF